MDFNLWLDDTRLAPPMFRLVATTVADAVDLLSTYTVRNASLDHDLGLVDDGTAHDPVAPSGLDLVDWMVENDLYPTGWVRVHSSNPVGADAMVMTLLRYGPFKVSPDPRLLLPL